MKFKISEQYEQTVKDYIQQNNVEYQWNQKQQETFAILSINGQKTKLQRTISQKMYLHFQRQKSTAPELTVNQWIQQFMSIFKNYSNNQFIVQGLNNQLLGEDYLNVKNRIIIKKQKLRQAIETNQKARKKYKQKSQVNQQSIRVGLQNIDLKIQIANNSQGGNDTEQVDRIKSVIKNGMWGCLTDIQRKLQQIKILQAEINELRTGQLSAENE